MLRGHPLPFDQEAIALFHERVLPDRSAAERVTIRQQVSAMLPAGKSEADRYAAYDQRFLIPPPRLRTVMEAAIAACRQATSAHIVMPPGESVDLEFVRNQPWSAFSRYHGNGHSTISVNLDFPLTVDAALELACHEGYPGHHVFNTLRDESLIQQRGWPEAQVQPTFSPQSYLSEAAAAFAPRLAFTVAERIRIERDVLFPLAGLPPAQAERYVRICELVRGLATAEPSIARDYLDGRLEFVRAEAAFKRKVLMAHSEAVFLYLNEYRSYMLTYTDGPERIRTAVGLTDDDAATRTEAWKRYQTMMTHLIATL